MSLIVDRRLNGKGKSAVNRARFLKRHRKHIKKAVADAIDERSIKDLERGEEISIPPEDINEPVITHGQGGVRTRVLPGNHDFTAGDKIERPKGGGQGEGGEASDSGEGEDDFVFQISQSEFLDYLFEDLALPNLNKRKLADNEMFENVRAGISNEGNPSQLNIVRSLRSAQGRRLAMSKAKNSRIEELEAELEKTPAGLNADEERRREYIEEELKVLRNGRMAIPFLDDYDLKFNLQVKRPVPVTKAVMFCLMDVSGSMDQQTKNTAKRFFILLYLFLQRVYEKTEVVFLRHHSTASEVDEQEFFYSRETGGTVVSSVLRLMSEILEERYPAEDWNIYGAQASDGDNWRNDSPYCQKLLNEALLPKLQYFSYLEITDGGPQELWQHYAELQKRWSSTFSMRSITDYKDIYPVFRDLFARSE